MWQNIRPNTQQILYSPELPSCDFFLLPKVKAVAVKQVHKSKFVEGTKVLWKVFQAQKKRLIDMLQLNYLDTKNPSS